MTFNDFKNRKTVAIEPIEMDFWSGGKMDTLEIKSIHFKGVDYQNRLIFDFFYKPGFARQASFLNEKSFNYFVQDCKIIEILSN